MANGNGGQQFLDITKQMVPLVIVVALMGGSYTFGRGDGAADAKSAQLDRIERKLEQYVQKQQSDHSLAMDHIGAIREALAREGMEVN